jgi:hypothetical protein
MNAHKIIQQTETDSSLPEGKDERFKGYGVMGLPFHSNHVLALRRFPKTSVGPAYNSVWHRNPDGGWTIYSNQSPQLSCSRFFGSAANQSIQTKIEIVWTDDDQIDVAIEEVDFEWHIKLSTTWRTNMMNSMGKILPDAAWKNKRILSVMSSMAGSVFGIGKVALYGYVPNGQYFIANPYLMWEIHESRASMAGNDFGPPGKLKEQARLGDFWLPQKGMFVSGISYFETLNPARHTVRYPGSGS